MTEPQRPTFLAQLMASRGKADTKAGDILREQKPCGYCGNPLVHLVRVERDGDSGGVFIGTEGEHTEACIQEQNRRREQLEEDMRNWGSG